MEHSWQRRLKDITLVLFVMGTSGLIWLVYSSVRPQTNRACVQYNENGEQEWHCGSSKLSASNEFLY